MEYAGTPLQSNTRYYWKVRVWLAHRSPGEEGDKDSIASGWSPQALWSMGLLNLEDWQGARWIGLDPQPEPNEHTRLPAQYLRREFVIDKPIEQATAYFSGLGESELCKSSAKREIN